MSSMFDDSLPAIVSIPDPEPPQRQRTRKPQHIQTVLDDGSRKGSTTSPVDSLMSELNGDQSNSTQKRLGNSVDVWFM